MGYYEDVYTRRLNRYGNNYQERVLTQRREAFRRYLDKSVYRINFKYGEQGEIPATFERYKQDHTEIMRYLFTEYNTIIPNGTVLLLPDPVGLLREVPDPTEENQNNTKWDIIYSEYSGTRPNVSSGDVVPGFDLPTENERPWMVFYLEDTSAKGYNRYVMLKMTHFIKWKDRDKVDRCSWAYMYGQEDNMLKDEIRSRSRMDTIYQENLKMSFFVMPANEFIRKDIYFIIDGKINHKVLDEYYRVTGYDIQSQDNVEYVTIDPIYEYASDHYDDVLKPELTQEQGETEEEFAARQEEQDNDFFWLQGG